MTRMGRAEGWTWLRLSLLRGRDGDPDMRTSTTIWMQVAPRLDTDISAFSRGTQTGA